MTLEITPTHRELAARLVQTEADGEVVGFYDGLGEVARTGMRCAVAVITVLARDLAAATLALHGPDPERQP